MTQMISRERFWAMMEGEQPDRIPRRAGFTPDLRRRMVEATGTEDLEGYFDMDVFYRVGLQRPENLPRSDYRVYYPDLKDLSVVNEIGVARISGDFFTSPISCRPCGMQPPYRRSSRFLLTKTTNGPRWR